jgi:hypothetical protein
MPNKINLKDLKKLIRENVAILLREESKKSDKELEDSLDQQVDDFFISYESEAKPSKNESIVFRDMTRSFLSSTSGNLFEAEEEKEDKNKEEKKLTSEDLDIESFAASVVRLIDNYDSLLEVRNTIARRAVNFLNKNYEPSVSEEFKVILEDQHDISIGKSKAEKEDEEFPAPAAARSGSGGGAA